jgi:hypothetical protein
MEKSGSLYDNNVLVVVLVTPLIGAFSVGVPDIFRTLTTLDASSKLKMVPINDGLWESLNNENFN